MKSKYLKLLFLKKLGVFERFHFAKVRNLLKNDALGHIWLQCILPCLITLRNIGTIIHKKPNKPKIGYIKDIITYVIKSIHVQFSCGLIIFFKSINFSILNLYIQQS